MIPFVKVSACGNDFLIIDEAFAGGDRASLARQLCDRHFGVGADGVEWARLHPAGVSAILSNADGSVAEISGNGTRCIAAWYAAEHHVDQVTVETAAGSRACRILARTAHSFQVETAMGEPAIEQATAAGFQGRRVSIGNPHFVLLVDKFAEDWIDLAREISADAQFADGCNVELARVIAPDAIEFRIYERGVGPTLSSGTGACAAAVAAMLQRGMSRDLRVISPGGEQRVRWQKQLMLTGPAQLVARGEAWL